MALYFNQIQQSPQTHILIIGVGGYPYLNGGTKAIPQTFDGAQMLGQLSSPPVSAEAFFNMAVELHSEGAWIKPLGSINVLVSPDPTANNLFGGKALEPATIGNIENAYLDWKKLCDADPENVAIFFFCGHGLDKAEHYLLAEDFGQRPDNPWKGSFAFDMTRRAFFSCKARTQLFFIDACRQLSSDMLKTDLPANPIEPPSLLAKDCKFNLTQKAAAANESAYGKKNEVSFYTKALIGALKGNASNNDIGEWRIATGTLSYKMNSFLQLEAPGEGYPQRCISTTSDTTDIIRFTKPPMVPLLVTCTPDAALPFAELSCLDPNTNQGETRPPQGDPWETRIKAGLYKIEANFRGGEYKSNYIFKLVTPPSVNQILNCM